MKKDKILVTGAGGQLGTVLTQVLRDHKGEQQVLATDLRPLDDPYTTTLDVSDGTRMAELVQQHGITQIYHLAAILSAAGERNPLWTWDINMKGVLNVLEVARTYALDKVYFPSSIAVHGQHTPTDNTPQYTVLDPSTVYGISKLAGELWGEYYFKRYGVDVRSLRYPGLISYEAPPGGGTTDYAVEIFHEALKTQQYSCFLKAGTYLPMLYMPDAIEGTLQLMEAPADRISTHTSYNIHGMSFAPEELAAEIKRHIPAFEMTYDVDPMRQGIADSWANSIDDRVARQDWGWNPTYDLATMTAHMLTHVAEAHDLTPVP